MDKKGFTLIELIVIIAVLGILAAISLPRMSAITGLAGKNACLSNMRTIARKIEYQQAITGSVDLEALLENEENAYFNADPNCPAGGTYSIEGTDTTGFRITCNKHHASIPFSFISQNKFNYVFLNYDSIETLLNEGAIIDDGNGNWLINEIGQLQNSLQKESRIFFESPYDSYSLKTTGTLAVPEGKEEAWGYGVFFETELLLNEDGSIDDTGYIVQFDQAYGNGEIVFRQRTDGKESNPFLRIKPEDILGSLEDGWWNMPHEIELHVESRQDDSKVFELFIDGTPFTENIDESKKTIQSSPSHLSHTGYRTWSSSYGQFEELEIIGR